MQGDCKDVVVAVLEVLIVRAYLVSKKWCVIGRDHHLDLAPH
jgi:hypothetical protein